MTSFDTTRTSYGTASATNRMFARLADLAAVFTSWNEARVTRNALTGLTDRELADIGLTRSDIDTIARSHMIR